MAYVSPRDLWPILVLRFLVRKYWCGAIPGRAHRPVIKFRRGGWPKGPCGWQAVMGRHGRRQEWICRHYEVCATCGRKLRCELPVDECPNWLDKP